MRLVDLDEFVRKGEKEAEGMDEPMASAFISYIHWFAEKTPHIEPVRLQCAQLIESRLLQNISVETILKHADSRAAEEFGHYIIDNELVTKTSYVDPTVYQNVLKYEVLVLPPQEVRR